MYPCSHNSFFIIKSALLIFKEDLRADPISRETNPKITFSQCIHTASIFNAMA